MVFESNIQYYSSDNENESDDDSEYSSDTSSSKEIFIEKNKNQIVLEDLEESYYYNVFWSAKEKEKLFKGIERYGKWNVEKIKRLLPNKTIIDIQMYISLLHKKYKYVKNNRSQDLYKKDDIYSYYENGIIESTEEEIKKEEEKAIQLIVDEQSKSKDNNEFDVDVYNMILKLFNIQLMLALTTKIFIRKKDAGIHKDTLVYIYLQFISWLREIIRLTLIVTEKRRLKKKKKSNSHITLEDINEAFYIMNFKNYQVDSPLSKLVFRRQGHLVLNSIFKIKHDFSSNFIHPDAKKSIFDERTNTWIRPYNIQPRYYHSNYNNILNDSDEFKKFLEMQKSKKTESYNKFKKKHKNEDTEHNENQKNGQQENNEDEDVERDHDNNKYVELNEKEEVDEEEEEEEEEFNDNEDNENEEVEEEEEEEEEDEDFENYEEDYNEQEDSIYEDSTDDNYSDSNNEVNDVEESNIDKLISSGYITRRSNQRLSNTKKRNRDYDSYENNKRKKSFN